MFRKCNMKNFLIVSAFLIFSVSCSFTSYNTGNSNDNTVDIPDEDDAVETDDEQFQPDKNDIETTDSSDEEVEIDDETSVDADESADTETDDESIIPDEDSVPSEITVTIGTYNLSNMFDSACDSGTDGSGNCNDMEVLSSSEFNSKVTAVASSIRKIGSDIQIMVEIEDETSGDAIFSKLSDIYDDIHLAVRYEGSQNLGVITKGEITKVVKHGTETDFTREFPEIHISYLGKEIIVFPAHFKAKSNDDPERRLREATKAAEIINEVAAQYPDALIVMAGDLNDEPGSDPLNALDSANLLRTASDLSSNEQCTYNYDGCSKIDHVYLSLAGNGEYIPKSAKVIKDGACGNGSYCLGSSDHAAIRADFKVE